MKKVLFLIVMAASVLSLAAAPLVNGRIIDPFSPLYDYMDALYSLEGLAKPNTNRPWSEGEARQILGRIDRGQLDATGTALYDNALAIIDEGQKWNISDDFGMNLSMDFSLEGYAHSNDEDFVHESDWVRGYAQRKPLMKLGFEFSVGEDFWTVSDILYRFARGSMYDDYTTYIGSDRVTQGNDGNWYIGSYIIDPTANYPITDYLFKKKTATNFYLNTLNFDFIWPHRAIASVGGENWNASINRDRMKIGDAHIGNLLVDDYNDYNDYFRLSFFGNEFRYDWYMMYFNVLTSDCEDATTEGRMFMIHTLDFRIANRVSFKVSENVMYKYSTFDLQFLNPAFIYHNLNNRGMFNALAYLEVNAQICKGVNVYGQFALDQARAPNEGYEQADSSGFIIGGEYTAPAFGGVLENYVEYVSTTPLLYRRDGVDFIKCSRYYHQGSNNKTSSGSNMFYGHFPIFEFIGFQFGGDTQAVKVGSKYTKAGLWNAEVSGLFLEHGVLGMYKSHNIDGHNDDDANERGKTPSGDVITRAISLTAKADLSLRNVFNWPRVSAQVELDWVGLWDYTKATKEYSDGKTDTQFSISLTVAL